MENGKTIQDTAADAANELIEHAVALVKQGAHPANVSDAMSFAERLSRHVQDIEDHDKYLGSAPRVATKISEAPSPF